MHRIARLCAPLVLIFLLALPAFAHAQGQFVIQDEAGDLNSSQVENAAQSLLNRGAIVAVYNVTGGGESDFTSRLEADGLYRYGDVPNEVIAIYVSTDPNYSEIRYGNNWTSRLASRVTSIRSDTLNANLQNGDYTAAFADSLTAINQAIAGTSSSNSSSSSDEGGSAFPWIIGTLAVSGGGYLTYRTLKKRSGTAKAFANVQQESEEARKQAGVAIADFGRDLQASNDKAQFDKVSYPVEDVEQLAKWQQDATQQFQQAQSQYAAIVDKLGQKEKPAEADYKQATADYQAIGQTVATARQPLEQATARRTELDKINEGAPATVDAARKALADANSRLKTLGDDFRKPEEILRPAFEQVEKASGFMDQNRAPQAIQAATTAQGLLTNISGVLDRYASLREGISSARAEAERSATPEYHYDRGLEAFKTAEDLLQQAAATLASSGTDGANAVLDRAEAARAEGVARSSGMAALQRENTTRIPQVKQSIAQLTSLIAEGRKTFETVDDFAESTWSDIRGNGSEAEASAANAGQLLAHAEQSNTMEEQDFFGAQQDLNNAEAEVERARSLIEAILQRLKDLETARRVAREEIALADSDINSGWTYVRSNDADVGKQPEVKLQQAADLVKQSTTEMTKERPDWLLIVKQVREANKLADEALAGARDEVTTMNRLRDEVEKAQQVATAEVQKTVQFATTHSSDIPTSSQSKLDALQKAVQAAYNTLQTATASEEEARSTQYRQAIERYTALQNQADAVYNEIYGNFQQAEEYRKEVEDDVQDAKQAIERADQTFTTYGSMISANSSGIALLREARETLDKLGTISSQADMERAKQLAQRAKTAADSADSIFRQEASRAQQSSSNSSGTGDMIGGMIIGSMLSDRNRHGPRGGGGGFGGGGFGGGHGPRGGGGGGGGGGGWGSGGSSGGSWGGGGGGGGKSGGGW